MTTFELMDRVEQPTAVIHAVVPVQELPNFFSRAFGQVSGAIQAQGVAPAGPPFALYFGMPGETVEVEAGFPVPRSIAQSGQVHAGRLPGGNCIHGTHIGNYDALRQTYAELAQWAETHHLTLHDEMWEVYLSDPMREPNPQNWRTEVFWPAG